MNSIATLAVLAHARDWDGPPSWFFPLVPLVWIAVIAIVWVLFRRRWHGGGSSGESVLAERYARGDIDEAEYRHRRDVLRSRT